MINFFNTVYGQLTIVATFFGTMWGLLKALGALRLWLKQRARMLKQYRQVPQKYLEAIGKLQQKINLNNQKIMLMLNQRKNEDQKKFDQVNNSIKKLSDDIYNNNQSTASMMLQIMMRAYHSYIIGKQPIPLDVRTALCEMFKQYKICNWHNHVPEDFVEKLMKCEVM